MQNDNSNSIAEQATRNECLESALAYLSKGLSVVPISKGKKYPAIPWNEFKSRLASEQEVRGWFEVEPDLGIGIVTGKLSRIVVVDIDPRHGGGMDGLELPPTLTANTGGGGYHCFYRYPEQGEIFNAIAIKPGIDIRGEGGLVVAAPSIHASGKKYYWPLGFDLDQVALCPKWLLDLFKKEHKAPIKELLRGVTEGQRHEAATRVAGYYLSRFSIEDWDTKARKQIEDWNKKNRPPLEAVELHKIYEDISLLESDKRLDGDNKEGTYSRGEWKAHIVNELIEESEMKLFHDETGRAYARFKKDSHFETWPCFSGDFQLWIAYFCYMRLGKPVSSENLKEIISVLSSKAKFDGELTKTGLRIYGDPTSSIFYDLADRDWCTVKITKEGWDIERLPSVPFVRYAHTQVQVEPTMQGDLRELLDFINIQDPDERLLLLCYIVTCFVPGIQHPILVVSGGKGSAKSTVTDMIKRIVDPSPIMRPPFPKNYEELALLLSQNCMTTFDNVSRIDDWLSDALCKACTGDAFSKRKLYTDEDAVIVSYRRNVVINGLHVPAERSDLLDRMILFMTDPIPKEKRKSEREIEILFSKALPNILGGLFTTLSQAMLIFDSVPRENLTRLADFDLYGRAAAVALGYKANDFIRALAKNQARQNDEAVQQSPIALSVMTLMQKNLGRDWAGTASHLLKILRNIALDLNIETNKNWWPQNPSRLSKNLKEVAANLFEQGIQVQFEHTGHDRMITLSKTPVNGVNSVNNA